MHAATIAMTRSRSRQGLEATSEASPRRFIIKATACTCPWAREAVTVKASATGTKVSPFKLRRMISIRESGRCERLPRVSLRTRVPSR